MLVTLVYLRTQLPHAALAELYDVGRSTVTAAIGEIRPLLAERGFAAPDRRGLRLRTLADVAAGRDQLDIDGLGETYVRALVEAGQVRDVADLFGLDHAVLAEAAGSEKRAVKLLEQIEAAKGKPLARVFCALGVVGTGRGMSRRIARHFGTMEAIRAADAAAMTEVELVGDIKAAGIVAQLVQLGPVIDKLAAAGVNLTEPQAERPVGEEGEQGPLAGQSVVVTGKMTGALAAYDTRDKVRELIERAGGKSASGISGRTTLLVAGAKAGSKVAKAEEAGIEILGEEAFAERIAAFLTC